MGDSIWHLAKSEEMRASSEICSASDHIPNAIYHIQIRFSKQGRTLRPALVTNFDL